VTREATRRRHRRQSEFETTFKLKGAEQLVDMYHISIVAFNTNILARARLYLTEHYVCVDANSLIQQLIAAIQWRDVSALTPTRYLLTVPALELATTQGFKVSLVVSQSVADQMTALWCAQVAATAQAAVSKASTTTPKSIPAPFDDVAVASDVDDGHRALTASYASFVTARSSTSSLSDSASSSRGSSTRGASRSASASSTLAPVPPTPTPPPISDAGGRGTYFYLSRSKAFHATFGDVVASDDTLLATIECALVRSDTTHRGALHVTRSSFAFASRDGTRAIISRADVRSATVGADDTRVTLQLADGIPFEFVSLDAADVAALVQLVKEGVRDDARVDVAAVTTHFHHAQLEAFRRTFALVDDELIDTHTCTFARAKLLYMPIIGKLYVARRHICFKRMPAGNNIIIPVSEIASVSRGRVAFVVREALRIETSHGSVFHFVGFAHLGATLAQIETVVQQNGSSNSNKKAAVDIESSATNDDTLTRTDAEAALSATLARTTAPLADTRALPPLRVVILTIGSRGDVQPTLALGSALKADGHDVTIGTHAAFKEFVEKAGLKHATLAGDPEALMVSVWVWVTMLCIGSTDLQSQSLCVGNGMFTPAFIKEALSSFRGFVDDLLRTAYDVVKTARADVLVQAPTCFAGAHIAEALGITLVNWFTMPSTPTTAFAHPFTVSTLRGRDNVYNFVSYLIMQQALWQPLAGQLNAFRTDVLKLPPLGRTDGPSVNDGVPTIYCFSKHLVPPPADWNPATVHVSGFWFADDVDDADSDKPRTPPAYEPSRELRAFLAHGSAPIYIGFGSITGIRDVEVGSYVRSAARRHSLVACARA
jgi:UDP:flavonoid glycosyltransferase YjiC (YdhE family)